MGKNKLKIGNKVMWSGGWGKDPAREAKVTGLEKVKLGQKEGGKEIKKIPWTDLDDRIIVSLSNGSWAYGSQITKMPSKEETPQEGTEEV